MPESPETFQMAAQLAHLFHCPFSSDIPEKATLLTSKVWEPGARLVSVSKIVESKILEDDLTSLMGSCPCQVTHGGKLTTISWSNGQSCFVHYAMTGGWGLIASTNSRLKFDFGEGRILYFNDPRKWGKIGLGVAKRQASVGPSVFADNAASVMHSKAQRRKAVTIRDFLQDQSVAPGVGNYIVNEVLWRAQIHPATLAIKLSLDQFLTIVQSIQDVILTSVRAKGVTIANYFDLEGAPGSFQMQFRAYQQVQCFRCYGEIVRLDFDGSGHYICPVCQPNPNS